MLFSASTLPDLLRSGEKRDSILAQTAESSVKELLVACIRKVATRTSLALEALDGRMKTDPFGNNRSIGRELVQEIRDLDT